MPNIPIKNIVARQILDSRGNPTVEVMVEAGNAKGVFGVPSGASTGSAEAHELRDGGTKFGGLGVEKAVINVNYTIAKKLKGLNVFDQKKIDSILIDLDGTPNKSKLGANAILGVSGAVCKAAAAAKKVPVYKYAAFLHPASTRSPRFRESEAGRRGEAGKKKQWKIPKAMMVMIEGGLHGDTNLNLQEIMIVPRCDSIIESVQIASEIFYSLKSILSARGLGTNLGNEGAESPKVESNRQALDFLAEGIKKAGYGLGKDVSMALDVAASEFYQASDNQYVLSADHTSLSAERLISLLKEWMENYSVISLEDPLAEEDWSAWQEMQARMPKEMLIVGDDLFVTQKQRLQKGIEMGIANAIIIKPNQVGTITETLETVKLAQDNGYKVIVSHRAGETTDDFIADFAVGIGADYIKAGSVARGERVVKYNRLMQIEQELRQ